MLHRIIATVVTLGLVAIQSASAQTSYPMLMSLKPVALQIGTAAECEVQSRYTLLGTHRVLVSGSGVTAEVVPPEMGEVKPGEKPKELTKLKLKITAAADAEPGVREFRLATPNGASTVGQLVIVRDPVSGETADNNSADKAQAVTLPAVLCGAIEKVEDSDFFKFTVEAGQSVAFHVRGQRLEDKIHDLQNHLDPIVFLRDAQGAVLAMSDNFFFADPFFTYKFEQAGEYVLEVRDVRYQGNQYWEYCVEVNSRPFVSQVFPLAIAAGGTQPVDVAGWLLPESKPAAVTLPTDARGRVTVPLTVGDQPANPVTVYATDLPLATEAAGDNDKLEAAQAVASPIVVNGRVEKENDLDVYGFEAKKGDLLSFEVIARRTGSQLDSYLRILNDKGQTLREDDDLREGKLLHADTWIDGWSVPADGKYFVELRDVHLRGGEGFGYALQISPSRPSFELAMDTDKTNLTPGTFGVVFARVTRKHGFTGEVQLHVDGLPDGVTATCGRILAGKSVDGAIVLSAAADAKPAAGTIILRGTAMHPQTEGQPPLELAATATPYQEVYMPGGGRAHWPVSGHLVSVGAPSDIRSIALTETDIRLKPGESKKIGVKIERAADAKANITLDFMYQHLSQIFANTLPEGVTIDAAQSQTLLAGGASEGHIVLKAAKDAPPVERQLASLMANFAINFVMKATYSSPPVFVSVEKTP
ncbi:MAG: PPC domain-containing protein [Planctomycetaceae bacterium]|nr:PPC domain-containing protein [Planctomycetaceae bacterium]